MAAWLDDLRYTLRGLSRSPGFVIAAVLSICIGIAANTTVFSMAERFVLYSPPVGHPSALMVMYGTQRGECCNNNFSWPLVTDLRQQASSFFGIAGYYELVPASIGGQGDPERVWGQAATTNFFDVAQLPMTLGRGFDRDDESRPVVVLGYRLWQRRYRADPAILGTVVTLSNHPFTVIGVAPADFRGLDLILNCEFWVPLRTLDQLQPNTTNFAARNYHWLGVVGRLQPGVTRVQASTELNWIAQRLGQTYPATEKDGGFLLRQAGSLPPRDQDTVRLFFAALFGVVLLVLGIACANVANLLLARFSGRQRELAVRVVLGAHRGQLMRLFATEITILAMSGGILGVILTLWATRALSAFRFPAPVPLNLSVGVDWIVVLYAFLLSAATGLVFGLVPAWLAARATPSGVLKGDDLLARTGSRWNFRNLLVVTQIAMSMVLLCIAGLFLRSMQDARHIDIGFRSRGILMVSIDPRLDGYTAGQTTAFLAELRHRVATLPGVLSAACTDVAPLSGGNRSDAFSVDGHPSQPPHVSVDLYMASPGYFETIGTPLTAGRDFQEESATATRVAIVNETFVRLFFPGQNAIGQRVSGGGVSYEIIGIAKDIKSRTLGESPRPVLYRSLGQSVAGDPSLTGYTLLVRTAAAPAEVAAAVRGEIHSLDPTLAAFNAEPIQQHLRDALFLPRLAESLFGIFGSAGLLLAAVGLFGVMSYSITRRTREIGIRLALGAQAGSVQRLIVGQGMSLAGLAVACGLGVALPAAKLSAAFLYGVHPNDPLTFTMVPLFLLAVAFLACWLPTRRIARIDPLSILRRE